MSTRKSILLAAFVFLISFGATSVQAQSGQTGTIIAKILAFRNSNGNIQLTLYNQDEGFPEDLETSLETKAIKLTNRDVAEVHFPNLPYGTYAIAGLHDENYNEDMDYNWIGMPKEGYCFSNDAKPILSPPSFTKAKFELNQKQKIVYITMQY